MSAFPANYARRVVSSVSSTLDEARRIASEVAGPEWVMAHVQTAARGRRGRPWSMPPGNFAATLVLPISDPAQAALRSFVASLALYDACVALTGREEDFALKWPNDVLLRGGKLAGILLETLGAGQLGIGIGVNLRNVPEVSALEPGALAPVSLHGTLGVDVDPERFLDCLANAYAPLEDQLRTFGFDPIRTAWLSHAARLGEVITARTTRETFEGTFVEVDGTGQLVLDTARGRVAIPAADVYF